jgi:hypothetical protein
VFHLLRSANDFRKPTCPYPAPFASLRLCVPEERLKTQDTAAILIRRLKILSILLILSSCLTRRFATENSSFNTARLKTPPPSSSAASKSCPSCQSCHPVSPAASLQKTQDATRQDSRHRRNPHPLPQNPVPLANPVILSSFTHDQVHCPYLFKAPERFARWRDHELWFRASSHEHRRGSQERP